MNDLDKITAEAGKDIWSNRPHWTKDDIAMIEHFIKSACKKATERKNSEMKKMNDLWERLHKQLGTEPDDDWDEAPFNYIERLQFPEPTQSRAAHASEPKPLERCSSNPHYEARFGDKPAAHASEPAQPAIIGGRRECPKCGESYSMADIHECGSTR